MERSILETELGAYLALGSLLTLMVRTPDLGSPKRHQHHLVALDNVAGPLGSEEALNFWGALLANVYSYNENDCRGCKYCQRFNISRASLL